MYVVTGVSGRTGSAAAEALLARGERVRVVVRDAAKGDAWKARGAEVAVAAFEDGDALTAALSGARGAYLVVPPFRMTETNLAMCQDELLRGLARGVSRARPAHVVVLSSIGAQHAGGTGMIAAMHVAERELAASGAPLTFLRAAYFMENWRSSLPGVLGAGRLFSALDADAKMPMVAARDIGKAAAELLLDPVARGARIVELSGPQEYSPADTAAALSAVLGKEVPAVEVPIAGVIGAMIEAGASPEFAEAFGQMIDGVNRGVVAWARGAAIPRRGTTPLATVLSELVAAQKG